MNGKDCGSERGHQSLSPRKTSDCCVVLGQSLYLFEIHYAWLGESCLSRGEAQITGTEPNCKLGIIEHVMMVQFRFDTAGQQNLTETIPGETARQQWVKANFGRQSSNSPQPCEEMEPLCLTKGLVQKWIWPLEGDLRSAAQRTLAWAACDLTFAGLTWPPFSFLLLLLKTNKQTNRLLASPLSFVLVFANYLLLVLLFHLPSFLSKERSLK